MEDSMKAWKWHWPVSLLAAALLLPAGLGAQQAPPAPPAPPEPPVWVGSMADNALAQARNRLGPIFEDLSPDSGWLGVKISEVSKAQAREAKLPQLEGVYVDSVDPGSPAAKAGLKAQDIIVQYNRHTVEGVLQFRRLVRETPPGRSASMRVWRGGREQTLSANITSRKLLESNIRVFRGGMPDVHRLVMIHPFTTHPLLGVRAEDVGGQLGGYFKVPGGRGVLVIEVNKGSAAEKAGVKAGDVIYQVQGNAVHTVDQLERALREDCSESGVTLSVVRNGKQLRLKAPIKCPQPPAPSGSSSALR
jgi:serine protease Do